MNLHCLQDAPPAWLGEALERFERQFWYPLGPNQRFRISHGRDYLPFFQAMGRATVLVAERDGEVLGTLARVERQIEIRNGGTKLAHYLCDLKVAPTARGGRVLPRLMNEARRLIETSGSRACYSIVMGGTGRLPVDYTGRTGIPGFEKIAETLVLRLSSGASSAPIVMVDESKPDIRVTGGNHFLRSILEPLPVIYGDASAVLEDTLRGKRLWMEDGRELRSAHVSSFRFATATCGADLLRSALVKAQQAGFPAIFVAMPVSAWQSLRAYLPDLHADEAMATLFGHELPSGFDWWVDTAEI
jgi:hypothetical protein